MALKLVLDEDLASSSLLKALQARGYDAEGLQDLGLPKGHPDPDVVKGVAAKVAGPWVLVTKDLSILEDHPGFKWEDYAIAWVKLPPKIRGVAAENAKQEIVHRHAHQIVEQTPGQHFTYTKGRRHKSPPGLVSDAY